MGQAAGTAAAMAIARGVTPAGIGDCMGELQQTLLRDDAYLPWLPQQFNELTANASLEASQGEPAPVRDGTNRPVGDDPHCWSCKPGAWISYKFDGMQKIESVSIIVDSGLDMYCDTGEIHKPGDDQMYDMPDVMTKGFSVEGLVDGEWQEMASIADNRHRMCRVPIDREVGGIRVVIKQTWGAPSSRLYAFYVDPPLRD